MRDPRQPQPPTPEQLELWPKSLARLRAEEPAALALLGLYACLGPADLPAVALTRGKEVLPPPLDSSAFDLDGLYDLYRRVIDDEELWGPDSEYSWFDGTLLSFVRQNLTREERLRFAGSA